MVLYFCDRPGISGSANAGKEGEIADNLSWAQAGDFECFRAFIRKKPNFARHNNE